MESDTIFLRSEVEANQASKLSEFLSHSRTHRKEANLTFQIFYLQPCIGNKTFSKIVT